MNKCFGLFLLALAFLAPVSADAANRFLVCTTSCTITAVDTSIWSTTSGGATGASVPGSGDAVILDASTCVGGTTCTATFGAGYNPTWQSVDMSACTASTSGCILDANTNANTITLSGSYTNTGAGTRTVSGGTWIFTSGSALWNIVASATVTNSPSLSFTSTSSGTRQVVGAAKTYGTLTVAASVAGVTIINSANTFATVTLAAPLKFQFLASQTIGTITNVVGTGAGPLLFSSNSTTTFTMTSANNWTCDWCAFAYVTFAGGGTFSATNSFDFGNTSGITISPPSGGGGGGRIIGG